MPFADSRHHAAARDWLRFAYLPGLDAATQRALLRHFGGPGTVLSASRKALVEAGGPAVADAVARGASPESVARSLEWAGASARHLVTIDDPRYPSRLLEIADPPWVLHVEGRVETLAKSSFAIVGSRNATPVGRRDAESFAFELSRAGLCIASGLALGIDAAAHRGGLAGGSGSIAVLGTGIDILYPRDHRALADAIREDGCVVSEFPLGTPPDRWTFPRRNRLISGLALGVLVVEAALRSGSLITAHEAAAQNRDVFAVPGSIHSTLAKGCHRLIRDGAKLVECAGDILEELGGPWVARAAGGEPENPAAVPDAEDDPVLGALAASPLTMDALAALAGLDIGEVAARLARLEVAGRVKRVDGGRFQRHR